MNRTLPTALVLLIVVALLTPAVANAAGHEGGDDGLATVNLDKEADFIKTLKLPAGTQMRIWAQGAQVANPVALAIDNHNRVYAAQTMRFRVRGVLDVREHMWLYFDDLHSQTTADRLAVIEKWKLKYPPGYFSKYAERISLFTDSTGSGIADKSTVFADGFNDPLDGTASGIAVGDNGTVYLASIPKIWALTDSKGTGTADQRSAVSEGYGPRFSISGHDLHGVIIGPDGKLYWSMGDRGYNITGKEGQHFANAHSGGVFRSNPDGSDLELIYTGLRNPEELAFDNYGNLFTVDNNADIGDASRVVYILEGGHSGWTHGWQLLGNAGFSKAAGLVTQQPTAWLEEGLWKQDFPGRTAWVLPPAGFCTAGPCGLAYVPETGWPDWKGRFLTADYRAGNDSGVKWFSLKSAGAGFAVDVQDKFIWGTTITDIAFGYDSKLYIANYLGGWSQADKGRILTLWNPGTIDTEPVKELEKLFAAGFKSRAVPELTKLLAHPDQRARQAAQFELVRRGKDGLAALATTAAAKTVDPFARLHAVWGLGQLSHDEPMAITALAALLGDADAHVREHAARLLGNAHHAPAAGALMTLLADADPRVKAAAAIALGKLKHRPALPALVKILADNDDLDPYLRHGAVMGLVGTADADALHALAGDKSKAVRLGVLLAERRLADPHVASFLKDTEPSLWAEAVRAVYDTPIKEALPLLTDELVHRPDPMLDDKSAKMLYLRLVNAAYRFGDNTAAAKLAEFAASTEPPEAVRAAALKYLSKWGQATEVDPVIGLPRPAPRREKAIDGPSLKDPIMRIIAHGEEQLLPTAVTLAAQFGFPLDENVLLGIADNVAQAETVRIAAVSQLLERGSAKLKERLPKLLADENSGVRAAAFDAVVKFQPDQALTTAKAVLNDTGTTAKAEVQVATARTEGEWAELAMGAPVLDETCDSRNAVVTWIDKFTKPSIKAGADGAKLPRLTDSMLPANQDDIARNVWFDGGEARFVLDLGKPIDVARVNTYSWHKSNRSPQIFTLWGATGTTMPDAAGDLGKVWKRIAKVDTGNLGEGGKQGSSVFNSAGALGTYHWLLWQTPSRPSGTFFSKLCVFAQGRVLPGLIRVATSRTDAGWDALSMGPPVLGAGADSSGPGTTVTWVDHFTKPSEKAGADGAKLPRLNDDKLATNADDIEHCTWFEPGESRFLLDLGKPIDLARINTYTWHQSDRSPQDFTVWGSAAATVPDTTSLELAKSGWTRIAHVDTWGLGQGGKHGSSILAAGNLGKYRWLLWQNGARKVGTFYAKIDVFAQGRTLPPIAGAPDPALMLLKQHVIAALGKLDDPAAGALLGEWLDRLNAGKAPPQVALELTEAAALRKEPDIADKLKQYRASFPATDALGRYRVSLWGGDAEKGRDLFRYHNAACMRCHAVDGDGGIVGPDLRGVPNRISRDALLESLIVPNAVVAPGYGTGVITKQDGTVVVGGIVSQTDETTVVRLMDGKQVSLVTADIKSSTPPVSSMPPMGELLSRAELRDIIAYLSSLR